MRITIKLLILILIFGCKNQSKKTVLLPEIKTENSEKQSTKSIFDLIINKKESPKNSLDSIAYKFDFSKRFTENEISILNLDTTKIGLNEYYSLTDQKFLTKQIDSISFLIYYKHMYGDELSKILRIKRKDSVFDLPLSISGGDVSSYKLSTEFINDSIFIKTYTHKQTAIDNTHLMAYATDSIVTKYKYNKHFEFREIKKDSFHIYKKYPTYHKNLKGKVFKTWSSPFKINHIQYQWEYEVKYKDETNETSKELLVGLVSQKLITWKTKEPVLDLDLSLFPYLYPLNISNLEYNEFKPQDFDINFDGYNDFQFYDRVQGGANHEYFVYLFNPKTRKFEFSKDLTGGSMADKGIELNKEKRIAYYSGKNGGGLYGFRRVHFNSDGSIKYEERFWNEDLDYYSFRDSINHYKYAFYYLKKKNGQTIDSIRTEKEVNDGGLESIYAPFFKWIETFDK